MNPACRVARNYPHLPVSRFIFLLSDTDVALYEKKYDQSRSFKEVMGEFVSKLAPFLGEHIVLFLLRLAVFAILLLPAYILTFSALLAAVIVVCLILACLSGRLLAAFTSCYKCGKIFFWVHTSRLNGRKYAVELESSSVAVGADNKSDLDDFVAARVSITMDSKLTRDGDDSSSMSLGMHSIYDRDYSESIPYEAHPSLESKILEEKSDRIYRPISDNLSVVGNGDEASVNKFETNNLHSPRAVKRLRSHHAMDSKSSTSGWRNINGLSSSQSKTFSDDTVDSRSIMSLPTQWKDKVEKKETDSMLITDFDDEMTMASHNSIQTKPTSKMVNMSTSDGQAVDLSPRSLDSGSGSLNSQRRKLMKLQGSSNKNSSKILVDFDDDISLDKSIFISPPGTVAKSPLKSFPSSTTTRSRLQQLSPTNALKEPVITNSASVSVMSANTRPVSARRTAMRNKVQQERKENLFLSLSIPSAPVQPSQFQQPIASGPGRQAKEIITAKSSNFSSPFGPHLSPFPSSVPFSPGQYVYKFP